MMKILFNLYHAESVERTTTPRVIESVAMGLVVECIPMRKIDAGSVRVVFGLNQLPGRVKSCSDVLNNHRGRVASERSDDLRQRRPRGCTTRSEVVETPDAPLVR